MELDGYYKMEINSKAFVILILTVSALIMLDTVAVRIGIANILE